MLVSYIKTLKRNKSTSEMKLARVESVFIIHQNSCIQLYNTLQGPLRPFPKNSRPLIHDISTYHTIKIASSSTTNLKHFTNQMQFSSTFNPFHQTFDWLLLNSKLLRPSFHIKKQFQDFFSVLIQFNSRPMQEP